MSEAIILGEIQKLESFLAETQRIDHFDAKILKELINELRMMVDFMRNKNMVERSRLNNLFADFAEMAQEAAELTSCFGQNFFYQKIGDAIDWLRVIEKRMMEFGAISAGEGRDEGVAVVGLEKDVQNLSSAILNEESGLVALCIKGMIGVGKTTLARQVYNHVAIVEKFRHRAWVSLSSDTSEKEVLVKLVHQLVELDGDSLLEEMDNRSLRCMLFQRLQGMPFLIVVDNLLPEVNLDSFLINLSEEGHGCRLLFTSRHQIHENLSYTHEMKALDSDKSWQLFLKTIDKFTNDKNKFSKELERKAKEMLKKCGGLPIAIIDVARQKGKQRLSGMDWELLFDSVDLSESLKKLEPMYKEMDEELKQCFLYMAFFKENAILRQEKVEQILAARGVYRRGLFSRSIIDDLVSQSVIEVVNEFRFSSELSRCRIHPLLHMLSIEKAEEEMSFEILRCDGSNQPLTSTRHRVVQCGRERLNHSRDQDKHHVSLIFHGGGRYLDDASQSYWNGFEILQVLDMEDFGVKTLSETIGSLNELRYLGLRNNYIHEIPNSFGGLKRLEVLDIDLNFMVEVPDVIWEMSRLGHLYMSDVIYHKPIKVDALQNIETLTYISIYDWTYEFSSLEMLTWLQTLGIEDVDGNSDVGKLFASLPELNYLEHLILRGFRFRSMPCLDEFGVLDRLHTIKLDGLLSKLPSSENFPPNIRYVHLVNSCLDEDPMLVLEKLRDLECLKLRNAYAGREMVIQHNGFCKLEVLCISELWNLRNVRVGEGAMPNLNQLEINNCPHLETLPQEIGSIKCLTKLKMVTTKHIATEIKKSGLTSKIVEVDIGP